MPSEQERAERWLQRCVGEWTLVNDATTSSEHAAETLVGTESVRAIGGTWVAFDTRTTEPASQANNMLMTLGYDREKRRIVGVVVTSMMSNLWIYDGSLDANGQSISLETTGPSYIVEGSTGRYHDTITFEHDDRRVFTSSYLGEDGQWHEFMRSVFQRTT
jgi:hypothetical protein